MNQAALLSLMLALSAPATPATPAEVPQAAAAQRTAGLELYRELPKDPMLVMAVHLDDPGDQLRQLVELLRDYGTEERHARLVTALGKIEADTGISLNDGFLAHVGPELALTVDLPALDVAAGALQFPPAEAWAMVLGQVGVVARAQDADRVAGSLERVLAALEYDVVDRDGLREVRVPLDDEAALSVYYGLRQGRLAVGFAAGWVEAALSDRAEGQRLVDGEDFRKVFGVLDERPTDMTYINLPKLRSHVAGSQIAQMALAAQPETKRFVDRIFTEEAMGMGVGSTTVRVSGGVRTTNFGPDWMSGAAVSSGLIAAMAVPNLFSAVDRGRTRRTLGDIESIAQACEGFSGDSRVYPGPTEGWVPVEKIAMFLEPVYITALPRTDGWEHPILYWSDGESYRILSTGRDGTIDRDWTSVADPTASAKMDGDIVFADGRFLVIPEQLVAE